MLVLSLVLLVIAFVATFMCFVIQEEVIRPCLAMTAVLAILFTIFCAPWGLKLTLIAIPIGLERFYNGTI